MMTALVRFAPESHVLVQERNELANALGRVCGRIEELEALERTAATSCHADVHAADVIAQLLEHQSLLRRQRDSLEGAMRANRQALSVTHTQSARSGGRTAPPKQRKTGSPFLAGQASLHP